jgi:hypothetical protein
MRWIASAWFHQQHLRQDITLSETLLVGERIASSLNIYILLLWSNSILTFLHLQKQRSFDRIFDQNWCLLECRRSILIYMLKKLPPSSVQYIFMVISGVRFPSRIAIWNFTIKFKPAVGSAWPPVRFVNTWDYCGSKVTRHSVILSKGVLLRNHLPVFGFTKGYQT